jgi:hypothetical protein
MVDIDDDLVLRQTVHYLVITQSKMIPKKYGFFNNYCNNNKKKIDGE